MYKPSKKIQSILISSAVLSGFMMIQRVQAKADESDTTPAVNQVDSQTQVAGQSDNVENSQNGSEEGTANTDQNAVVLRSQPTETATPAPADPVSEQATTSVSTKEPAAVETQATTQAKIKSPATDPAPASNFQINSLAVVPTTKTSTSTDGTINVTNATGMIQVKNNQGDTIELNDVYGIADFLQVRNIYGQRIMEGNEIGGGVNYQLSQDNPNTALVLAYNSQTNTVTYTFVDSSTGQIISDVNGDDLQFTFSGDQPVSETNFSYFNNSNPNPSLYGVQLNYGGHNIDLNFSEDYRAENPDWQEGELFSIPNQFSANVNYVDADTGQAIIPSQSVSLQTNAKYQIDAQPAPSGYELVGVLRDGEAGSLGQRINESQINKGQSEINGVVPNDLDTNFMSDYYIKRYLPIGSSYTIRLQDYGPRISGPDGNIDDLVWKPTNVQVTRLNAAGDVELIYIDAEGNKTQSVVRHNTTYTVTSPDDFWASMINGGAAYDLRAIHNDMVLGIPDSFTFVYRKIGTQQGQPITVNYVDDAGHVVSQNEVLNGVVGDSYTTAAKNVTGYNLINTVGETSGTFSQTAQTVTYVYQAVTTSQTTDILGVPVSITLTKTQTPDGSIQVVTRDATVGTIKHVFAIADFNQVRTIDDVKIMAGTAITNASDLSWVSSQIPNGLDTRLIFSYDTSTQKLTISVTDKQGHVLKQSTEGVNPSFDNLVTDPDAVVSFTPSDLTTDPQPARKIVKIGSIIYMIVSYGGDNVDINMANLAQNIDDQGHDIEGYHLDVNPGNLFAAPNKSLVKISYVDAETGEEIEGQDQQTLDITTGNTFVTQAKSIDGYQLVGKLQPGATVQNGSVIDPNLIQQGISSSDGVYTPDFDTTLLSDYTILRHLEVGGSYDLILQDFASGLNDEYQLNVSPSHPITIHVTRLNQQGDIQIILTDLSSGDVQTKVIPYGQTDIYSNPNDFWAWDEIHPAGPGWTVRTIKNALNLSPSSEVVYVYRKIEEGQPGPGIHVWTEEQVPTDAPHVDQQQVTPPVDEQTVPTTMPDENGTTLIKLGQQITTGETGETGVKQPERVATSSGTKVIPNQQDQTMPNSDLKQTKLPQTSETGNVASGFVGILLLALTGIWTFIRGKKHS